MSDAEVDPRFSQVVDPGSAEFETLYGLYCEAIPAPERKDRTAIEAMCFSADHRLLLGLRDAQPIGFIILFVGKPIGLLEYMAVAPGLRGVRLGSALYRHARALNVADRHRPLLIEVESGRHDAADRADRLRRIGFYRRLGCRRVEPLDYVIPIGGGEAPIMDLLVDGYAGSTLTKALLREWIEEIYLHVYGCGVDHPLIDQMLAPLPEPLALC